MRIAQEITKLNMDATFYDHNNSMRLGICMRNDRQSTSCVCEAETIVYGIPFIAPRNIISQCDFSVL